MSEAIIVRGARVHNLQSVDLNLPKNQLIVFTGVSGSGKSSLAFDTLYAEGQRRYIESLSSYARQFLGQMQKPDVDQLAGLAPSISIEQKTSGGNPRSTVGTVTEIHDYLRVLFARLGHGYCPECQQKIEAQSPEQIVERILADRQGDTIILLAPVVREQKGAFKDYFEEMRRRGYVRGRVDGQMARLDDDLSLDRLRRHNIDIVIDRITVAHKGRARLAEAVEQALKLGLGNVIVQNLDDEEWTFSSQYTCLKCQQSFDPPTPQLFSFNSPRGMCKTCDGLGYLNTFDPELLIADPSLSIKKGAIDILSDYKSMSKRQRSQLRSLAVAYDFKLETPWQDLSDDIQKILLHGGGLKKVRFIDEASSYRRPRLAVWPGYISQLLVKYKRVTNPMFRKYFEKYMKTLDCPQCHGARLNPQAANVRVGDKTLVQWEHLPIDQLIDFVENELPQQFTDIEQTIGRELLKEIRARLGFLQNVGLHYLTLDRPAPTLSGGEAQRIRLASQIGSGLVGVLYVLDEPSIGLHPRDNARLLRTLQQLRDQGNTVIVVEHDEETMRAADHVVDFGPGPGIRGGHVVAQGALEQVISNDQSVTGRFLSGADEISIPERRPISLENRPKVTARKTARKKSTRASSRAKKTVKK